MWFFISLIITYNKDSSFPNTSAHPLTMAVVSLPWNYSHLKVVLPMFTYVLQT